MRFKTPSAVYGIIINENNQILLQKRLGGVFHGLYDVAISGHVEPFEKMTTALRREAKEEIGIHIEHKDLEFAILLHSYYDSVIYYNAYFKINNFIGEAVINEPNKTSELAYFDLENLPTNLIPDRRVAIEHYLKGEHFVEYGWF
ncbi:MULTISPECIES: NUDIX domain-containing protein [unclassified Granulicatella]|uniref:NUDIX domain-containing protein n=1 Tax=unclassified Granulicatella TaxID=2630493 RepID=UPI001074232E|nr:MULTISPECIES: NUDIX domain-containing protein [unclassified Granulicatella]MBF0779924.1 NUDIX domain-containing protein [Granulicatella sp. 19428wC4_WM01]TFU96035.1 NUDIX domain-containing protein [Granulicatella sp. WM01]